MRLTDILSFIVRHPFNRGSRLKAIGRFVRWQFGTRLLPYPVALPFVDDMRLLVERGATGATGNYYCGLHEAEDMAFVLHFLRSGDVFYDIGANIGSYTLLAAAAGVGEIHCFEPARETIPRLRRNLALNAVDQVATVHSCALGAEDGEIKFSIGADTTNHVLAAAEQCQASESVALRRFDQFYVLGRPGFVKMDVEGFEEDVIAGATKAFADPCLMGILVEENGSEARYGRTADMKAILAGHGFAAFKYDPFKRHLFPAGECPDGDGNVLYLRDVDQAQSRVSGAKKFRIVNGCI